MFRSWSLFSLQYISRSQRAENNVFRGSGANNVNTCSPVLTVVKLDSPFTAGKIIQGQFQRSERSKKRNIEYVERVNQVACPKLQKKTLMQTFCKKTHPQLTWERSRHRRVCLPVVHTVGASSPSGWSGLWLCSRSQLRRSSWAGQSVPCRSSRSLCAGWPAIPTCWCQRVLCRCTWTEDAPADCGCCICPSFSLRGDEPQRLWTKYQFMSPCWG